LEVVEASSDFQKEPKMTKALSQIVSNAVNHIAIDIDIDININININDNISTASIKTTNAAAIVPSPDGVHLPNERRVVHSGVCETTRQCNADGFDLGLLRCYAET